MSKILFLILIISSVLFSNEQNNKKGIDWFAWSDEVFSSAKEDNKLVFVSIDDVDCHWSYAMQEESFENDAISTILNRDYIAITINREDISSMSDELKKSINSLVKNASSYPINIILTPNKEILFLKNYVPNKDSYGEKGLSSVLPNMIKIYRNDKKKLAKLIKRNLKIEKPDIDGDLERDFVEMMMARYDKKYKGFGEGRKYPLSSHLNLLYDIYMLTGDKDAFKMVDESLTAMANGGIYDQIDGGFFRYSTNQDWTTPNFEKTLYTTALVLPLYTKMYIVTKNPLYKKVVVESIAEIDKRLLDDGLYWAVSESYSNGLEGGYYTYSEQKLKKVFKKENFSDDEIKNIFEYFGIVNGNNNLFIKSGVKKPKKYNKIMKIFKEIRSKRKYSKIDKNIILSWNALMIKAKVIASIFNKKYLAEVDFTLKRLRETFYVKDKLYNHTIGKKIPTVPALFEDYSLYIDALLEVFQYTFNENYINFATVLSAKAKKKFYINMIWYKDKPKARLNSKYENRYYTTALSKHFHNLLTMSSLNYSRVSLYNTRELLKDETPSILEDIFQSPEALKALIRAKHGDIILKSKAKNLINNMEKIKNVKYPYVYMNNEEIEKFIACDSTSCFSFNKEAKKTITDIEKKMLSKK